MVIRKMKEKCKDAARMRREKERTEFVELSKLLPLPSSTTSQLDKASIIRLTSSYLRMRSAFPKGLGESWGEHQRESWRSGRPFGQVYQTQRADFSPIGHPLDHQAPLGHTQVNATPETSLSKQATIRELGSLILQTLDGFVFALHRDGKIMYISETASVHLGLPQIDLSGSSVFEYTHLSDHNDLREVLALSDTDRAYLDEKWRQHLQLRRGSSPEVESSIGEFHCELGRSFCLRMKCILPKRNAGLVSNGYKAIHCTGYLKVRRCVQKATPEGACVEVAEKASLMQQDKTTGKTAGHLVDCSGPSNENMKTAHDWECYALVAVGHSLLPSASTEVKLNNSSFMFRSNLDLRLFYVESSIFKLLGYQQADMMGQSLYQFVHLNDVHQLEEAHRTLLRKSQTVSRYFRLMRKSGGHIWVQIHATLISNPRNVPKSQHVVSICTLLSTSESEHSPTAGESAACFIDPLLVSQSIGFTEQGKPMNGSTLSSRSAELQVKLQQKLDTNLQPDRQGPRRRGLKARLSPEKLSSSSRRRKTALSNSSSRDVEAKLGLCSDKRFAALDFGSADNQEHSSGQAMLTNHGRQLMAYGDQNLSHNSAASSPTSSLQLIFPLNSNSATISASSLANWDASPTSTNHLAAYQHQNLRTARRASDDTCSVGSSVMSSYSTSSSAKQQSNYNPTETFKFHPIEDNTPTDFMIGQQDKSVFAECTYTSPSNQLFGDNCLATANGGKSYTSFYQAPTSTLWSQQQSAGMFEAANITQQPANCRCEMTENLVISQPTEMATSCNESSEQYQHHNHQHNQNNNSQYYHPLDENPINMHPPDEDNNINLNNNNNNYTIINVDQSIHADYHHQNAYQQSILGHELGTHYHYNHQITCSIIDRISF